ncbi:MAG TPA: pilus assembly protein [Rhodocyclaceae bacterium]|nr:pilus assembly protein [Rhodocyclaceae bacterium]
MKDFKLVALVLGVAILSSGCSTLTTPESDARFGASSMTLWAQQSRDPAASVRNEKRPVDGIEGKAASNAVDQYYKSFTKPAPQMTILNLGVAEAAQ